MSNLTDFFPVSTGSDEYGPSGDPDYLMDVLMIGGGSGISIQNASFRATPLNGNCQCSMCFVALSNYCNEPYCNYCWCARAVGGTGGGIYIGTGVAVYSGVSIPITIGAGGANSPCLPPVAGTPAGKGSPGSPTTFGCLVAYGGGAPATVGPCYTTCVPADDGGVGGAGWGRYSTTIFIRESCSPYSSAPTPAGSFQEPAAPHTSGMSYNYSDQFGVHRGTYTQSRGCFICSFCAPYYTACNDPKYSTMPNSCSMTNYYCLNVNNVPVVAGKGHNPLILTYPALSATPSPYYSTYPCQTGFGNTKCFHDNGIVCCIYPFGGIAYAGSPPSQYVQYCPNTGTGGDSKSNSTGGAVWLVYPDAYPAASSFPGGVDCTPCVKTGYRAYRWFSPGSFTMP